MARWCMSMMHIVLLLLVVALVLLNVSCEAARGMPAPQGATTMAKAMEAGGGGGLKDHKTFLPPVPGMGGGGVGGFAGMGGPLGGVIGGIGGVLGGSPAGLGGGLGGGSSGGLGGGAGGGCIHP
uniref:Glycine-rich protein n=1 Tax=Oryza nivara TaxID=4536 RepID=A0A0E0JCW1_ORYNI